MQKTENGALFLPRPTRNEWEEIVMKWKADRCPACLDFWDYYFHLVISIVVASSFDRVQKLRTIGIKVELIIGAFEKPGCYSRMAKF